MILCNGYGQNGTNQRMGWSGADAIGCEKTNHRVGNTDHRNGPTRVDPTDDTDLMD
jgi:hypothetical protein